MTANGETSFGLQVRQHREALGLTRKELARRVNCSIETIRKIESGERYPSGQIARLLAQHLGIAAEVQLPHRPQLLLTPEFPLIGRAAEWEALCAAWHTAIQGAAHLVCIAGDAGIGKTRLAEELLTAAQRQGFPAARTRAYALEGRLAYAPVADWLRSKAVFGTLSKLDAVWRSEIARLLPELLIEDATLPAPQPMTERWHQKRLFEALLHAFSLADKPLLLVLDDLQWCDSETLEWLQYLLGAGSRLKLLVVTTLRDTEVDAGNPLHNWLGHVLQNGQLTNLSLAPLNQQETTSLGEVVAQDQLNAQVAAHLFHQCAGNPLFVIESMRFQHGQQQAVLTLTAQHEGPISLPPKIYAVIQAGLVRLSPQARAMAEFAAVAGRAFGAQFLAQASGLDEMQVAQGADELLRRRLIRERGGAQYDFSHDRVRDVVYSEIPSVKRGLLHRAVAQTLESIYSDCLDTVVGEVAGHYQQTGALDRALTYFRQAAAVAERLYAHGEVERYLEHAIATAQMWPDNPEFEAAEIDLWDELGWARLWLYGYGSERVREAWSKTHTLAMQTGTNDQCIRSLLSLATITRNRGEWRKSRACEEQALGLVEKSNDTFLQGSMLGAYASTLYRFGELDRSLSYFRRLRALSDATISAAIMKIWIGLRAINDVCMAKCLWLLGFPDQAQSVVSEALEDIRNRADVVNQLAVIDFCGMFYIFCRNADWVQRLGEELSELHQKYDFPSYRFSENLHRGWALAHKGDAPAGAALVREGINGYHACGDHMFDPFYRALLAEALALAGAHKEAIVEIETGIAFANEHGDTYWNAHLLKLKGDSLQSLGVPASEAETWYQRAVTLARSQQARSLELRASTALARLWHKQNRRTEAFHMLSEVYDWFTEGFDTPDLMAASALLADLSIPAVPSPLE